MLSFHRKFLKKHLGRFLNVTGTLTKRTVNKSAHYNGVDERYNYLLQNVKVNGYTIDHLWVKENAELNRVWKRDTPKRIQFKAIVKEYQRNNRNKPSYTLGCVREIIER